MATLRVVVRTADDHPLPAPFTLTVTGQRTRSRYHRSDSTHGTRTITDLPANEQLHLLIEPAQWHRPVSQFASLTPGQHQTVRIVCPIDPDQARPRFLSGAPGENMNLGLLERANLCNLSTKMLNTPVGDEGKSVLDYVLAFERITTNRATGTAPVALMDALRAEVAAGRLHEAPGLLHPTPDSRYRRVLSVKSPDRYGNLQLVLFSSGPDDSIVLFDVDIDDAQGIEHVFHVVGSAFGRETHPYNIHEILTGYQALRLPYTLV